MKNIATIDLKNPVNSGHIQCNSEDNLFQVRFVTLDSMVNNLRVEVLGSNEERLISEPLQKDCGAVTFTIPMEYFINQGTMKVRLLSAEGNSGYVNFVTTENLDNANNIVCKYDSGAFSICKYARNQDLDDAISKHNTSTTAHSDIREAIPTKLSQLEDDMNFGDDYEETDPTVPEWAKQPTKPSYTADEVGADPKGSAKAVETELTAYVQRTFDMVQQLKVDNAHHADWSDWATVATSDSDGNYITRTYETKTDATSKLTEAKGYSDSKLEEAKADATAKMNEAKSHAESYTNKEVAELSDATDVKIEAVRDELNDFKEISVHKTIEYTDEVLLAPTEITTGQLPIWGFNMAGIDFLAVEWNGVKYGCISREFDGAEKIPLAGVLTYGNHKIYGEYMESNYPDLYGGLADLCTDTGEPFCLTANTNDAYRVSVLTNDAYPVTVALYKGEIKYHNFDLGYEESYQIPYSWDVMVSNNQNHKKALLTAREYLNAGRAVYDYSGHRILNIAQPSETYFYVWVMNGIAGLELYRTVNNGYAFTKIDLVDSNLNLNSTNPVQNQAVTEAINELDEKIKSADVGSLRESIDANTESISELEDSLQENVASLEKSVENVCGEVGKVAEDLASLDIPEVDFELDFESANAIQNRIVSAKFRSLVDEIEIGNTLTLDAEALDTLEVFACSNGTLLIRLSSETPTLDDLKKEGITEVSVKHSRNKYTTSLTQNFSKHYVSEITEGVYQISSNNWQIYNDGGTELLAEMESNFVVTHVANVEFEGCVLPEAGIYYNFSYFYPRSSQANKITEIKLTLNGYTFNDAKLKKKLLPIATTDSLGGVIVGDDLTVTPSGQLSAVITHERITNTELEELLK